MNSSDHVAQWSSPGEALGALKPARSPESPPPGRGRVKAVTSCAQLPDDAVLAMEETVSQAPAAVIDLRNGGHGGGLVGTTGEDTRARPTTPSPSPRTLSPEARNMKTTEHKLPPGTPAKPRITFNDFKEQYIIHQDHEHELELLKRRQYALMRWLCLARRLQRVTSWLQDGLVDMMFRGDKAGFARVHQRLIDLDILFITHWKRDLQLAEDFPADYTAPKSKTSIDDSFYHRLSSGSKTELTSLLTSLRSDPNFISDRIRNLKDDQLKMLRDSLKPQHATISTPQSLLPRSRHTPKAVQQEAFSQGLEDYAASFERSSTLSFLLFNLYGNSEGFSPSEAKLRLDVWSSVCSSLFLESSDRFMGLIGQILDGFVTISEWTARQKMELFLLDLLQRGSFLVDQVSGSPTSGRGERVFDFNTIETDNARQFFDDAVERLFDILDDPDSGFPRETLRLVCEIIPKLGSFEAESRFRGNIFVEWFLERFLQQVISFPEVMLAIERKLHGLTSCRKEECCFNVMSVDLQEK